MASGKDQGVVNVGVNLEGPSPRSLENGTKFIPSAWDY